MKLLLTQSSAALSDIIESDVECDDINCCDLHKGMDAFTPLTIRQKLEPIDMNKPKQIFVGKDQLPLKTITFEEKNRKQTRESKLGRGGFGDVYMERIKELGSQPVVNKTPLVVQKDEEANDAAMRKWFKEFELIMSLNGHPNIIEYMYFVRDGT